MGVLACDRVGCDNIMCDRISDHYGYICNDCFEELVKSGPTTDIASFMYGEPIPSTDEGARSRYDAEFGIV